MEVDESIILSGKHDVAILLIQFIGDKTVEHDDEVNHDSFDFITRERGFFSKK